MLTSLLEVLRSSRVAPGCFRITWRQLADGGFVRCLCDLPSDHFLEFNNGSTYIRFHSTGVTMGKMIGGPMHDKNVAQTGRRVLMLCYPWLLNRCLKPRVTASDSELSDEMLSANSISSHF